MEAAGLAVGVIALAGLAEDCINLLSLIYTVRNAARDFDILETKLDIEKTLLFQWADRVRLLSRERDPRLEDFATQQAVNKVLHQLRSLLRDATALENRYGLQRLPGDTRELEERKVSANRICRARQKSFKKAFEDLCRKVHTLKISTQESACWVIRDKAGFEALIANISYFVDSLHKLVPDATGASTDAMIAEDFSVRLRASTLLLVCDAAQYRSDIVDAATQSLEEKCHRRILDLLRYPEMNSRENRISPAHERTFEWVLNPRQRASDWDDLVCWLKSESGIYWIRGKAGSGKSTLMKYIWSHPRTRDLMRDWAKGHSFMMANFYFWRIGSSNQNSLVGLFRGIVCQILQLRPALAQPLFPKLYERAYGLDGNEDNEELPLELPSMDELKAIPLKLDQIDGLKDTKICMFIDGFDEFAGDYRDGVQFFRALTARSDMKLVISSRPEPILVDAFSSRPSLRLEILNKDDIRRYAWDHLGKHHYMQSLIDMGSISEVEELIGEIVEKARGVFLWVVLACRSLLDGFASFDRMDELRHRIDELPPELEDLFKAMLIRIDRRYRAECARILKLCQLHTASTTGVRVPAIGLALLEEAGMDPTRITQRQRLSLSDIDQKCVILEGRLRSRCGGLLETTWNPESQDFRDQAGTGERSGYCFVDRTRKPINCGWSRGCSVEFMHRTVFDFLNEEYVWETNLFDFGDNSFCPEAAVAGAFLLAAQLSDIVADSIVDRYARESVAFTALALMETSNDAVASGLLRRFEEFFSVTTSLGKRDWPGSSGKEVVVRIAVEAGFTTFVEQYFSESSYLLRPGHWLPSALLYSATNRSFLSCLLETLEWSNPAYASRYTLSNLRDPSAMVKLLLSYSFSPYQRFGPDNVEVFTAERRRILLSGIGIDDLRILEQYVVVGRVRLDPNLVDWVKKKRRSSQTGRRGRSEVDSVVNSILRHNELNWAQRDRDRAVDRESRQNISTLKRGQSQDRHYEGNSKDGSGSDRRNKRAVTKVHGRGSRDWRV